MDIRFLNCCEENDYGTHIFEDPDTHEVVGITPAGKFHVRCCDLNADHLVKERADRAKFWEKLDSSPISLKETTDWALPEAAIMLRTVAQKMIHKIPYLSGKQLEKHRALKAALALFDL